MTLQIPFNGNKDRRLYNAGDKGHFMKWYKRGVMDQLLPIVISLVAVGITLAIGFLILAEVASNTTVVADSNASTAIQTTQEAMSDIPTWLPIIIINSAVNSVGVDL